MKTLLCQVNTTPGDFAGNTQKIKEGIRKGFEEGVDLIVFPELTIPGYLVRDMIYEKGFVEKNLAALQEIIAAYDILSLEGFESKPVVVVGYIDHNRSGVGKPYLNRAAVIQNGHLVANYTKRLLPFYDVFDEGRYFESGTDLTVINVGDKKFGIIICEDGWNDKGMDNYDYRDCPLEKYREIGVHNIISINSSPFAVGKPQKRMGMFAPINKGDYVCDNPNYKGTFIYVNQIGGQDELIFDGNSFISEGGRISAYMPIHGTGDQTYCVYDSKHPNLYKLNPIHYFDHNADEVLYQALKLGLKDYVTKSGFKEVVIGSSGGIDSAVVLALACDALGPQNVHGIRMPSIHSSEGSKTDALTLHENLGCWDYMVPISHEPFLLHINESLLAEIPLNSENLARKMLNHKAYNKVADENIQARLRGLVIMHYSNAFGALPLTTGNKTELAVGYCTLYGDMNGGFAPINDLYKLTVKRIARHINKRAGKVIIPEVIIDKPPSAELSPGQTDESSLLPYSILDPIVFVYIEQYMGDFANFTDWCGKAHFHAYPDYNQDELLEWTAKEGAKDQYNRMIRLIKLNEFKRRQAAPGIKTSQVAFGTGRRLPIVKK